MESVYEFDTLTELPPLPPELFDPMDYSSRYFSVVSPPLDSLPPFPSSDFTPYGGFAFSDHHQNFSDTSLSLLTRHHYFPEPTHFEKLFINEDAATPFLHMPDLKSYEHTTTTVEETKPPFLYLSPPPPKRRRLGSLVRNTFTISPSLPPPPPPCYSTNFAPPSSWSSSSSTTRSIYGGDRRRKISDRIRSLEKLMPCERKMSLCTILEEAHKYITFLQSQIGSLRWMPLESVYLTAASASVAAGDSGEAEILKAMTRQQIMQVMANSQGAQEELYTRGVCVFSYEQLLSVKMMRNL
ncbi:unnamed protein product [Cochlearia groenlandica]